MSGGAQVGQQASGGRQPVVLYSTHTYLKYRMEEDYRGQHYAWCSPIFDGRKLNRYALGANQPPSADPAAIYEDLHRAVKTNDEHNAKLIGQKKILPALGLKWLEDGHITDAQAEEIVAVAARATFQEWRPIILVIPLPSNYELNKFSWLQEDGSRFCSGASLSS